MITFSSSFLFLFLFLLHCSTDGRKILNDIDRDRNIIWNITGNYLTTDMIHFSSPKIIYLVFLIVGGQMINNWNKLQVNITFKDIEGKTRKKKKIYEGEASESSKSGVSRKEGEKMINEEDKIRKKEEKRGSDNEKENEKEKEKEEKRGKDSKKKENDDDLSYAILEGTGFKEDWLQGLLSISFQASGRKDENKDLNFIQNTFTSIALSSLLSDAKGGSWTRSREEFQEEKKNKILSSDSNFDPCPDIFDCLIPCSVLKVDRKSTRLNSSHRR